MLSGVTGEALHVHCYDTDQCCQADFVELTRILESDKDLMLTIQLF